MKQGTESGLPTSKNWVRALPLVSQKMEIQCHDKVWKRAL